jgi:hypothetical protein
MVTGKAIRTTVRYANATGWWCSLLPFSPAPGYLDVSVTPRFPSGSARSIALPVGRYTPHRAHLASTSNCPAREGGICRREAARRPSPDAARSRRLKGPCEGRKRAEEA